MNSGGTTVFNDLKEYGNEIRNRMVAERAVQERKELEEFLLAFSVAVESARRAGANTFQVNGANLTFRQRSEIICKLDQIPGFRTEWVQIADVKTNGVTHLVVTVIE